MFLETTGNTRPGLEAEASPAARLYCAASSHDVIQCQFNYAGRHVSKEQTKKLKSELNNCTLYCGCDSLDTERVNSC